MNISARRPDFEAYLDCLLPENLRIDSGVFRVILPNSERFTLTDDEKRLIQAFSSVFVLQEHALKTYISMRETANNEETRRFKQELRQEYAEEIESLKMDVAGLTENLNTYKDILREIHRATHEAKAID
jgi:hypothetical protein